MKNAALFISFLFTCSAFAQKASVLIVDPDIDTSELEKDFKVERPQQVNNLPDIEKRDEVLKGIKSVKKYDQLKKDILYNDLSRQSTKVLIQKYPDISTEDLKQMKKRMR